MAFAVRHRGSPTTLFASLDKLDVRRVTDAGIMAVLQGKTIADMTRRFDAGHRAYVGLRNNAIVAWGWVATRTADIGELGATIVIPERERYLWNFVTRAEYRGQGIYPRLLRAIVNAESQEADTFWIAYAPENHASAAGVRRAGFEEVAELSFDAGGRAALRSATGSGRTMANTLATRMLGLPLVEQPLTPCWRCVRAGRAAMSCAAGTCQCDYQRPEMDCAAGET